MFRYSVKSFPSGQFMVVHRSKDGTLGCAAAGFDDEKSADRDAADRNSRAKDLGLDCTYVVKLRSRGEGV